MPSHAFPRIWSCDAPKANLAYLISSHERHERKNVASSAAPPPSSSAIATRCAVLVSLSHKPTHLRTPGLPAEHGITADGSAVERWALGMVRAIWPPKPQRPEARLELQTGGL